ncbi:MAG: 50S ribosomal protein L3 N(5)-glutamine methyltransferase [Granulosicoccus sp.]
MSKEGALGVLTTTKLYSIESAIRSAAEGFEKAGLCYGHGTDTALDEASWLILHALGLSPVEQPDYARALDASEVSRCNAILHRRIEERLPAAYLTGQAWFAGHPFHADSRALVPRSPLAEFINSEFFGVLDSKVEPRVLDLCTGGGCIAIACAYALPESKIDASDLSEVALSLAQENVKLHDMQDRVHLLRGSLFEPIDDTYDLIISNPPYVDSVDISAMPEEFHHEPLMGLAAGSDGLDLVRIILSQASDYLSNDGCLVVEVGNSYSALESAFAELDFTWLEFTHGGMGVFLLHREQLVAEFGSSRA